MKKQHSKRVFGSRTGVSFGDDATHARNTKEIVIRMYDWFTVDLPTQEVNGTPGVTAYSLDLTQNFFNPLPGDSVSGDRANKTKNRIKKVVLDVMTPGGPISYEPDGGTTIKQTALPMIQAGVPCMDHESGTSLSPSSLVGQSSLVLHPDLRRPWVTVGSWNYEQIFKNTQIQPWYADPNPAADVADFMELFRIRAVDGVDGVLMTQPSSGTEPVFLTTSFQFRVMTEIACPIALVPQPAIALSVDQYFAGVGYNPAYTKERTPMQYELVGLQNAL